MTRKVYLIPKARYSDLALDINFLATQLEDYPDNPIFGAPKNDSEYESE